MTRALLFFALTSVLSAQQITAGEPTAPQHQMRHFSDANGVASRGSAMTRPPEITTTNTRPVGAEWSCTACEQPSEGASMAPPAGGKQVSPTVIGVNAGVDQRAHLAGREHWGGYRLAGRPSTGQRRLRKEEEGRLCANCERPGWWQRHLGDTAIHLGATSADAATSWGRVELNPMLRSADGRFGARGLGLKLGLFGAVELVKWRLAKRYPRERWVRVLSLGPAAAFGGVAVRNWSVR